MTPDQQKKIEDSLAMKIRTATRISEGHISAVYRLVFDQGMTLCAKCVRPRQSGTLDLEGWMLDYLKDQTDLPVPVVHFADPEILVMDDLGPSQSHHKKYEAQAAECLAALHGIKGDQFGFARDTCWGPFLQPNPLSDSWADFFIEQRLLYMARQAHGEGKITAALLNRVEDLATTLPNVLPNHTQPALIHGDVWRNNIICDDTGLKGFIDPAIYYADPEIELAFLILFSTFSKDFFEAYSTHHKIADGFFEQRRHIYNLYPLLAHVRIFGEGYVGGVEKTLTYLGSI